MRYFYSAVLAAFLLIFTASVSNACEMRSVIREQINSRLSDIEISVDVKDLENEIHDMVHSRLDREKDRLKSERDKLRDERRKLERERRDLRRERGRVTRDDHEEDEGWGGSMLLAFGLYGAGLFLLTRRGRKKRGNTE